MSNFKNANIAIAADVKNATSEIEKLSKSMGELNKSVSDSKKRIEESSSAWTSSAFKFNQYVQAISIAGSTLKSAMDFGKEISAFESVQNAFNRYADSVGISSNDLLQKLKTASGGIIDDLRIMQSASKAMAKGVTTDSAKLAELMQIANQKAKIFGKEGTETFNKLVDAINKGSKEALEELGVKLPEGFDKTTKGMTKAAKQSKILEEVLGQGKREIKAMGGELTDSSDSFARFETSIKNLKTSTGTLLLPALSSVAEGLTVIINKIEDVILGFNEIFKDKPDINYNLLTSKSITYFENKTKEELAALKYEKLKLSDASYKSNDPDTNRRSADTTRLASYENNIYRNKQKEAELDQQIKDKEAELINLQKKKTEALEREASIREQINFKIKEANEFAADGSEKTKQISDNTRKALESFANLADTILPKMPKTEAEAYDLLVRITAQAGGMGVAFGKATDRIKNLNDELSDTLGALTDDLGNSFLGGGTNRILDATNAFNSRTFGEKATGIMSAVMSTGLNSVDIFGNINGTKVDPKETAKKSFGAIANQLTEVIISGVNGSNFADVMRSAIGSIASQKAQSYGSNILSSLFSGGGIATGALTGFVGSIAVSAIANNWEKWFGDHGKEETKKSNAETKERGSNAILQTYAAMLNPFMTDDMLNNLYDSRYAASGNLVVSYKSKRAGGLRGLVGGKNYTDTTPQRTYDLIAAMENAVDVIKDYNVKKEKELDLLSAQGYNYQVLTEQMNALADTMDRVGYMNDTYSDSWSSGEKFSIDLSDNIQDLKKAYYEALREYGSETASRKTRADTNFLNLFPYLDDTIYGGTVQYVAGYKETNRRLLSGALGYRRTTPIYGQYDFDAIISDPYSAYSYIENASNQLDDRNATRQMFELIKMAGSNQYELAALQYTDSAEYEKQYIEMLERSRTAAELVMKEQEQIYLDATQTFEQQSAALQMYQDAQNQYYSAKLEMLSAEQAKEEQIKKEEAAANLRRQEQMEALLGFTGEIARTGNNVYILEGADQVGALKEMIQQYGDNPEALAALQAMLSAAQSKAKFGKIA